LTGVSGDSHGEQKVKFFGGRIEPREYQISLYREAIERNTLIVLPTGLGKTIIAAMVAEYVLKEKNEKVIFLAPTRPLITQHFETMKKLLDLKEDEISRFTGEVDNEDRLLKWVTSKVVISTPQVVLNDMRNGLFNISTFGLIIFDEAHRASGNYAYVDIARNFLDARHRLILGITASPGGDREKLDEINKVLGIEAVRIKTENDADVQKYMGGIDLKITSLKLPQHIKELSDLLRIVLDKITEKIRTAGVFRPGRFSRSEVAQKIGEVIQRAKSGEKNLFVTVTYMSAAIRIDYLLEYLESQGLEIAYDYVNEILTSEEKTLRKTASIAGKIPEFNSFIVRLKDLMEHNPENPKMRVVLDMCEKQISDNPDSRVIVFTHFRKTSDLLTTYLREKSTLLRPIRFIGQAGKSGDEGLKQKDQDVILQKFRNNIFNVLVATSVAEEGLDIPATDLVIFFEPVPSEIRSIQRRGRTGRTHAGSVRILMYEGTRDAGYYFSSVRKETRMKRNIKKLQDIQPEPERSEPKKKKLGSSPSLDDFS
jgi:Fanconi anemia group M protein